MRRLSALTALASEPRTLEGTLMTASSSPVKPVVGRAVARAEPLIHDAVSQQDRGLVDVRSRQNEYIDIQPGITGGRQFKDGHSLRW